MNEVAAILVAELGKEYSYTTTSPGWVEVLVDCAGAQNLYTYAIPPDFPVYPGDILAVPFGNQQVGAIAIRLISALPDDLEPQQIREIDAVVSRGFFPAHYWTLLNRVAEYYQTPLMQVIRVALPPGLLRRSQRRIRLVSPDQTMADGVGLSPIAQQVLNHLERSKTGSLTWQYLQQQVPGASRGLRELQRRGCVESYLEPPQPVRPKVRQAVTLTTLSPETLDLSPRQREILEVLRRQGGDLWMSELLQLCHTSSTTLKTLERKGVLVIQAREQLRAEAGHALIPDSPKALTPDQQRALNAIQALSGPAQVLLHGVTGSGKTEVYLQAIAPVLQRGQSALVLVPEIGLTPQLTDRFRARFGSRVCVYHSALSEGERYDTWRQMLLGEPQVVIGTRSAIFAPLPQLGLIVLDEEHDNSFKQDQPIPCYHARTIAAWRMELEHCPLIVGSATPSLESWFQMGPEAQQQSAPQPWPSLYLALPQRVQARPLPPIEVVDMRQELRDGNRSLFSRSLRQALQEMQTQGQRGILFIHRRGHSTFVSCRSCGYVLDCPHCDVSLAYHYPHEGATRLLRCHYCNHTEFHPTDCPACGSPYLKFFGSGTQRVVQELAREFPDLRCIRFDSDTTRTKGAHRLLLSQFAAGEADLLVGTQMLTKGLDLPQVTLVGVIAADGLLHLSDYCASERAFQTLTQVAGRAGRGDDPGQVIIQTYTPDHPVILAVKQHEYEEFIQAELTQRSGLNYPPYGRLALLRLSSPDAVAVQATARRLATALTTLIPEHVEYQVLGPAPATIFRVARRYRWQILVKLVDSAKKFPDLAELRLLCPSTVNLTIDIDPLTIA